MTETLEDMRFQQSHFDYSLFTKKDGSGTTVVVVYVDDILVTTSNHNLLSYISVELQTKFKMKDLGELKFLLGIEVARSEKGIVMSQRKYARELIVNQD